MAAVRVEGVLSVPHPKGVLEVKRCRVEDLHAVLDWTDLQLAGDYFFRSKQMEGILKRPTSAVWAVLWGGQLAGLVILYRSSTLHNLFISPEFRSLGIGEALLQFFAPERVRAKTNMLAGDPVPWYERNGYVQTGVDDERPHIALMERAAAGGGEGGPSPAEVKRRENRSRMRRTRAESRKIKEEAAARHGGQKGAGHSPPPAAPARATAPVERAAEPPAASAPLAVPEDWRFT